MTRTRTITKLDNNATTFRARMAAGHFARIGHTLTGYYITENGISTLRRTCCDGNGGPAK